jgi:hypothetical protein
VYADAEDEGECSSDFEDDYGWLCTREQHGSIKRSVNHVQLQAI